MPLQSGKPRHVFAHLFAYDRKQGCWVTLTRYGDKIPNRTLVKLIGGAVRKSEQIVNSVSHGFPVSEHLVPCVAKVCRTFLILLNGHDRSKPLNRLSAAPQRVHFCALEIQLDEIQSAELIA